MLYRFALICSLCSCLAIAVAADDKKGVPHKHAHETKSKTHGAHDHGTAQIDLAVEGMTVDIELHTPAMGIVGFEYSPTSAADKKKQADALAKLKSNIGQVILFDPAVGCRITSSAVEVVQEEEDHAEVDGDFKATCAKNPAGTKVSFGLSKLYPSYQTVKVQVVGAAGSTGATIKGDQGTVTLPK